MPFEQFDDDDAIHEFTEFIAEVITYAIDECGIRLVDVAEAARVAAVSAAAPLFIYALTFTAHYYLPGTATLLALSTLPAAATLLAISRSVFAAPLFIATILIVHHRTAAETCAVLLAYLVAVIMCYIGKTETTGRRESAGLSYSATLDNPS